MKKSIVIRIILPCIYWLLLFFYACEKTEDPNKAKNLNGKTSAVFNEQLTYGTVEDIDGNIYKTIEIGNQTWMAENLRTTTLNDGLYIPLCTEDNLWTNSASEVFCNINNTNSVDTIATYGRLYNWYAINTGKLAPAGWHIPTEEEWQILLDYLGENALNKLMETGDSHWNLYNSMFEGATNESGFTALPGGYRYEPHQFNNYSSFFKFGYYCGFWSVTEDNTKNAYCLYFNDGSVSTGILKKTTGLSVRCIKD